MDLQTLTDFQSVSIQSLAAFRNVSLQSLHAVPLLDMRSNPTTMHQV